MGHKTHPVGFRLGITQEHRSFWYANLNAYAQLLQEDYEIRRIVLNFLLDNDEKFTGITKIVLLRNTSGQQIDIVIHTSQPGLVVGKAGIGLTTIDTNLSVLMPSKKTLIKITEIKNLFIYADLVAEDLVEQLENRLPFRRVLKGTMRRLQQENETIKGFKIQISGRLNGAEIARTEWLREGRVPLQTLRAQIDYSYKTAKTIHGILGIKVWLFKGEASSRVG